MKSIWITNCTTKRRGGFTLTESAIVLAVMGAVMSAIWSVGSIATENIKREQAFDAVTMIVQNVRADYAGQMGVMQPSTGASSSTHLTPILVAQSVVPGNLVRKPYVGTCTADGNICADTPWGGVEPKTGVLSPGGTLQICGWVLGTSVDCSNGGGTSTQVFGVSVPDLNFGACVQLASQLSSASAPPGLVDVFINGTSIVNTGSHIFPVSTADTSAYCQTNATLASPQNTLSFVWRLRLPANL